MESSDRLHSADCPDNVFGVVHFLHSSRGPILRVKMAVVGWAGKSRQERGSACWSFCEPCCLGTAGPVSAEIRMKLLKNSILLLATAGRGSPMGSS